MKYYVVIDAEDGEEGGVFENRKKAGAAASSNNAQKYDQANANGGFGVVEVEGDEEETNKVLYKMAKAKKGGKKMESKRIDRYLGLNETEAHTYEQVKGVPQSFLDEAHNRYFEGNLEDFRSHFKTISEVAQFMSFVIENGMDVREIQKMLKILA